MPSLIERVTAPAPSQPAAGAAATPPGPGSEGGDKPTVTERAVASSAPTDAGDAPALVYEVEFGGTKRRLTPAQIASTFDRYQALNHDHAQVKPVVELAKQLMERSKKSAPEVAQFLLEAAKNFAKAGTPAEPTPVSPAPTQADDDALTKWEQENAASLPPGYRDMHKGIASVAGGQKKIVELLQTVLTQASGVVDAAKTAQVDARSQRVDAIKRTIANNLNAAQQRLGLPDDAAKDFMMFAAERGFTMEDFADADLTLRVAQDFKANMGTPELERLRGIAAKRQAFTGSLGSTPNAGPATGGDAPTGTLDRLVNRAAQTRGM